MARATVDGESVRIAVLPSRKHSKAWSAFVDSDDVFGLDVETTSIEEMGAFSPDAKLRMVQFGTRNEAWCLDPHDSFWRLRICGLLTAQKKRFVTHTNYDPHWVRREFGIELGERSLDTLPMASLLYPSDRGGNDLKTLSAKLIDGGLVAAELDLLARFKELAPAGERVGKKLKSWGFTNIPLNDPYYGIYGGLDAVCARRLLDILAHRLVELGMGKLSKREQRIQRMSNNMQWRGMLLDSEYTQLLLRDIEDAYLSAERRLLDVLGFSPRSPKLADWFTERGVQFTQFTPTGRPQLTMPSASSPGTLPGLITRYGNDPVVGPIFKDKLELSSKQNLLNNLRSLLRHQDKDGFIHPRINTQAAITGRMSVVNPAMQTFKKNDKRLRGCLKAKEGHVLVTADYASQEVRIGAAFSRDPLLLKIVRDGLNQHIETCKAIFNVADKITVMETSSGKTYYDAAKTLDFAQQYGAWPRTIGDQLGWPRSSELDAKGVPRANPKATQLWLAWRDAYAGLVEWTDRAGELPVVVNPWGRRIPRDPWRTYANGNYFIQSSGRDVLGDALVRLADAGWEDSLWLCIHDEIILEVPESEADEAAQALEDCMRTQLRGIPITAEASILGARWNGEK